MKLKTSFFIFIMVFALGCDGDGFSHIVEIELEEHNPKLTATSTIKRLHGLTSRKVFVSHSKGILDTSIYEIIDDATVKLYKDDELIGDYTWLEDDEFYFSPWFNTMFESGHFEMVISAPGFETIRAEQKLPVNAAILGVNYKKDEVVDAQGNVKDLLEIEIEDDRFEENFYSVAVSAIGTNLSGTTQTEVYGHTDDLFMQKGLNEEFFPDEIFNGGKYILRYIVDVDLEEKFELNTGGTLEEFNINVLSYSKSYFDYSTSIILNQANQDSPFSEPVIVTSNWENGYGIFNVVNLEKFKLEL